MTKSTYAPKHATAFNRKKNSLDLCKAMAAAEGVPLPNAKNGGEQFDEWLKNKLAAVKKAAKGKINERNE